MYVGQGIITNILVIGSIITIEAEKMSTLSLVLIPGLYEI